MDDGIEVGMSITKKNFIGCDGVPAGFVQFEITSVINCQHLFVIECFAHHLQCPFVYFAVLATRIAEGQRNATFGFRIIGHEHFDLA